MTEPRGTKSSLLRCSRSEMVWVSAEAGGRREKRKSRHGRDFGEVELALLVAQMGWERVEGLLRMTLRHMVSGQLAHNGI